ncbi:MAG: two-component system, cell cycle response regulator [Thermoanaerobaculia bacterium]|jgi:diguanylate cyclase (GGDEF)-like protein|nr:two-component system, cell cycle response regulator [Thermoanaerobaculia bacterium]
MSEQPIGVYAGPALVASLRQRCPSRTFVDGDARDRCRVVIIDNDSHSLLPDPPRKSLVRVLFDDDATAGDRREGDIRVSRATFLANPDDTLAVAEELAGTIIHAAGLESELAYMTQIHELMAITDASAVSERITRTVLEILGLHRGTLFLHDPRLERYVVSYSSDPEVRETGEFLPGVPPGLLQRALSSGESFAADAAAGMIVMPLQAQHDLIGVIRVPLDAGENYDPDGVADVSRYLRQVASVLSNIYQLTRSRDLAMRDDLTKAFNRRFFDAYLDEEIERARRYAATCSIIFLDLDDLKTVNNAYGHLAGSRTLQEVAKRILGAVRGIDKVVRFGGDEFCIILPQTDQEQAVAVAHRVRRSMMSAPFHLSDEIDIAISASFGIATYPTHGLTKDDLIRQADAAMYRVKSTTKDAVGVAVVGAEERSSSA